MKGKIDAAEIRDFLRSRGSDCDIQQALSFMNYYDRDGDSALSIEELIKAMSPYSETLDPELLSALGKQILEEAKYASRSISIPYETDYAFQRFIETEIELATVTQ